MIRKFLNLKNAVLILTLIVSQQSCQTKNEIIPDLLVSESEQYKGCSTGSSVPSGFYVIDCANGIRLYKKDYTGGQPDYVQEINLQQANIKLYQGNNTTATANLPNPSFPKYSLNHYWNIHKNVPQAFSVTNLQFFAGSPSASLAFPLKYNNAIISAGYGNGESYPKRKLSIYGGYAEISDYNNTSNNFSTVQSALGSASTVMVGLHPTNADKSKYSRVGRTFIGIKDGNGDGKAEYIYIFTSRYATQSEANQTLLNFGCQSTIMFDGGGSTQMIAKGVSHVVSTDSSPRTIPSIIAVESK